MRRKTIAARFVRYSSIALPACSLSPSWAVMPTVASGGTSATAMPTPGSADVADRRGAMYPAAAPAVIAMPRSSRPGNVREITSLGRSSGPVTDVPTSIETSHPTPMASAVPNAITTTDVTSRRFRAVTNAAAAAVIGVISGATSIAPITTAPESANKPNAAIPADKTISDAKLRMYGQNPSPSGSNSSTASIASSSGSAPWRSRTRLTTAPTALSAGAAAGSCSRVPDCSVFCRSGSMANGTLMVRLKR